MVTEKRVLERPEIIGAYQSVRQRLKKGWLATLLPLILSGERNGCCSK